MITCLSVWLVCLRLWLSLCDDCLCLIIGDSLVLCVCLYLSFACLGLLMAGFITCIWVGFWCCNLICVIYIDNSVVWFLCFLFLLLDALPCVCLCLLFGVCYSFDLFEFM